MVPKIVQGVHSIGNSLLLSLCREDKDPSQAKNDIIFHMDYTYTLQVLSSKFTNRDISNGITYDNELSLQQNTPIATNILQHFEKLLR